MILAVVGITMTKPKPEWPDRLKRFLKAELKRHDVSYGELAKRLKATGFETETEASVANKVARGTFTAIFFLAALEAIGCETVNVGHV